MSSLLLPSMLYFLSNCSWSASIFGGGVGARFSSFSWRLWLKFSRREGGRGDVQPASEQVTWWWFESGGFQIRFVVASYFAHMVCTPHRLPNIFVSISSTLMAPRERVYCAYCGKWHFP
ncbi:hypothetical protein C8J57DRAFT_156432 [Mycena rebaudengoi]|nr:hypothetical protein C8J57DRAFT_156432 [Mycena rebaudengoi]